MPEIDLVSYDRLFPTQDFDLPATARRSQWPKAAFPDRGASGSDAGHRSHRDAASLVLAALKHLVSLHNPEFSEKEKLRFPT